MHTRYLQLSQHYATGVVLSDSLLRFVTLTRHHDGAIPSHYAELAVPEGCVKDGVIVSKSRFIAFLKTVRKTHKIESVALVLHSTQIKTVSVPTKGEGQLHIKEAVEKLFALPVKDVVFDSKAVGGKDGAVLEVVGISKKVSEEFIYAFKKAGITVFSIEPAGHAISRAVVPAEFHGTAMVVNIDTRSTTVSFVSNGRVSETATVAFSDLAITKAIMDRLSLNAEAAGKAKREEGMLAREQHAVFDAIADDCAAFVKQVNDAYISWKSAHTAVPSVEVVYVTGAGSLIRGLADYMSAALRVPVKVGNVWGNCLSFDDHIPSMPLDIAVRYGAAIGATLVGSHTVNLVPDAHRRSLRRKHVARRSGKLILSFVFGVLVGVAVTRIIAIPAVHSKIFGVLHKIETQW